MSQRTVIPDQLPKQYVLHASALLADWTGDLQKDGCLVVKDGRIDAVGAVKDITKKFKDLPFLEALNHTVVPGLINSHTHCSMGFFRGLGVEAEVADAETSMIESFLFPAEKSLDMKLTESLSYSYICQGIRSGVTTFADHYYFIEGVGKAFEKIGARAFLAETIADLGGAFPNEDTWSRAQKLIENWPFDSNLITPVLGPHAADTVSDKIAEKIFDFRKSNDIPLHMHLSQTSGERTRVLENHKKTPVEWARDHGLLNEKTLAVHLVSATREDLKILKDEGATAVYCPSSQILYEKPARFDHWLQENLPFSIATDCAASNDACDVLNETKIATLLEKNRQPENPALSSKKLLQGLSNFPAKALGKERELGTLNKGAYADFVFIKNDIAWQPSERFQNNLIFSNITPYIDHVVVNGQWVLKDQNFTNISLPDIKSEYETACLKIKNSVQN